MTSAAEVLLPVIQKKLDGQRNALESARTRAAVALTVSGVVAGLFLTRLGKHTNNWQIAALVVFVLGGTASVFVLMGHELTLVPKGNDWVRFAAEADVYFRSIVANGNMLQDTSASQLAAVMAADMQDWYGTNTPRIRRVQKALSLAWFAVVVQIVLWGISAIFG